MSQKYKKQVFTLSDSAPWAILLAITTSAYVWAIVRNQAAPPVATLVTGLAVFAFWILVFRHYLDRWISVTDWNQLPQIGHGVAFDSETRAPTEEEEIIKSAKLANRLQDAINFWVWATGIHGKDMFNASRIIYRALEGATITLVDNPIPTAASPTGYARGTQMGQDIQVVGPPLATLDQFVATLQEEVSHLILGAFGKPVETHHRILEDIHFAAVMEEARKNDK